MPACRYAYRCAIILALWAMQLYETIYCVLLSVKLLNFIASCHCQNAELSRYVNALTIKKDSMYM